MVARVGPSPASLVRVGLSPKQAEAVERAWDRWDADYGFPFRLAAGVPSPGDRARLDAGEEPGNPEPPEPPGFDLAG